MHYLGEGLEVEDAVFDAHLLPICIILTHIGQFSTDIEEHVILPGSPFLHKVRGKHPCPEHNAVIFETS